MRSEGAVNRGKTQHAGKLCGRHKQPPLSHHVCQRRSETVLDINLGQILPAQLRSAEEGMATMARSPLPKPAMITEERSPSPEFSPLAIGEDFSPLPAYKAAGDTALDFGGLLAEPLKVHEDLKSGCGGQTWPAGMVLARHMLRYHRDELKNARMLVPHDALVLRLDLPPLLGPLVCILISYVPD